MRYKQLSHWSSMLMPGGYTGRICVQNILQTAPAIMDELNHLGTEHSISRLVKGVTTHRGKN